MVSHNRKHISYSGELLGLPGVGKSWIAHNGSDAFPKDSKIKLVPQGWTLRKLNNTVTGIWKGRIIFPLIINLLMTNFTGSWRRKVRSALLVFERLGRVMSNHDNDQMKIYDEGLVQALWALVYSFNITESNLKYYDELFRRAVNYIGNIYYVSCPGNLCVRQVIPFSYSNDESSTPESSSQRNSMAFVLRQLRVLGIKIVMINNARYVNEDSVIKKPLVSVVIPMRNEVVHIKDCLISVLKSDYPDDLLEILVIDGGSDDGSSEIVAELIKDNSNIRLVTNPERITPAALNVGIREATGDVLVRMDVHSIYPSDYISRCVEGLFKYGADNVGGVWNIQPGADTFVAKAIALAQSHPVGVGNVAYRIGSKMIKWVDTVPYGCYRKEVFNRIGGFDNELIRNQDDELNARLRKVGGKILLDPTIQCTYFARPTLMQAGRMFYQYGYFKPLAAYKIGKAYTVRQLVPPIFVALIILLAIGGLFSNLIFWVFFVLIFVYLMVISAASVSAGFHYGAKVGLWLPVVFIIMHFAYGIGSLQGVVDFLIRKKKPVDVQLTR